jgi:hypothetical protein
MLPVQVNHCEYAHLFATTADTLQHKLVNERVKQRTEMGSAPLGIVGAVQAK